jgi:ribonuclease BN (tRNA processing enzyme)
MKLTILGSGTFVPNLDRNCSGYLVEIENEKIIFDFGRGTIHNLLRLKTNLYDLDKIFISHMHTDHASELPPFISFIIDNPEKKKLRDKYTIFGPRGIKNRTSKLLESFNLHNHKNIWRIQIKELSDREIVKGKDWKIKTFKAKHGGNLNCLSYRLESKKKVLFYLGDSAYSKKLIKGCQNSDLAILEATLPEMWKSKEHLNGKEAGKLATKAKIKKLIVTHVSNTYLPKVKKDICQEYKGKFAIARDLMKIII